MTLQRGDHYVALGSSFAAGPGLKPVVDGSPRLAGRSTKNYAHVLAEAAGLVLDDVTFSGATTADLLESHHADRPAQLDAVTPTTRLVTITAGGNDIGYLPTLTQGSFPWPLRLLPQVRRTISDSLDDSQLDARFDVLRQGIADIAERVRQTSPSALVVLVDYLTILPSDASVSTAPLPSDLAAWGRHAATRLTQELSSLAQANDCIFVAAGEASLDHHAWAADPWTRRFHPSLRGGAPFHPTLAGMRAVARLIQAQLPFA